MHVGCPSLAPLLTAHFLPHLCVGSALHRVRAYFNVQLMTICAVVRCNLQLYNGNCAVVVVNLELEQWKGVGKNGEKREILIMNYAKSWLCSCTCSVWKGGNIRNGRND